MSADLADTLIRLILLTGFAADISGEFSLAVLVGCLVKIAGGTDNYKLDRVQKSGFSSAVFTG